MMVAADHDVVLRPSMAASMSDHLKDLEQHVVKDCWHFTPEHKPAELNRLAVDWLRRRFAA
jgi:soluble epoxide hydrolase / lipid-phosphate phosphatase